MGLFFVLSYILWGRGMTLWFLGSLLVWTVFVETVRLRVPEVNRRLLRLFGGILREEEVNRPSGILWNLTGCFATVYFFSAGDIVVTALCYLVVGDALASLVGQRWGVTRVGLKSLEGSAACFIACFFVGAVFLQGEFGVPEILVGAFAATLAEALPLPLNDNLWIPLLSAAALTATRFL